MRRSSSGQGRHTVKRASKTEKDEGRRRVAFVRAGVIKRSICIYSVGRESLVFKEQSQILRFIENQTHLVHQRPGSLSRLLGGWLGLRFAEMREPGLEFRVFRVEFGSFHLGSQGFLGMPVEEESLGERINIGGFGLRG